MRCIYITFTCLNLDIVASGALRCGINNGGCWKKTQMGKTYSACRVIFTISRLTYFHLLFSHILYIKVISSLYVVLRMIIRKAANVPPDSKEMDSKTAKVLIRINYKTFKFSNQIILMYMKCRCE